MKKSYSRQEMNELDNYLIKNKINFRVLFIGNGDQSNEIKKYVINNKLTKNILIKNHMKNAFPYLKKSDVLILS